MKGLVSFGGCAEHAQSSEEEDGDDDDDCDDEEQAKTDEEINIVDGGAGGYADVVTKGIISSQNIL